MARKRSQQAGEEALARIDDAVASFEPVSDTGIYRPSTRLDLDALLDDLAESSDAFLEERMHPLYSTEWWGGGPGGSNSEAISTVDLPSGWRVYVTQAFNLYWDLGNGRFVLAAANTSDEHAADIAFLRILFTDSGRLHRDFMPNCSNMSTSLTLDEVTDLFLENGFDPDEWQDEAEEHWEDDGEDDSEHDSERLIIRKWVESRLL
jgi:hypothetical protein